MSHPSRRGLQAPISDNIGQRIVSGRLAAGELLDLEQLEIDFGVSRTVVREVIKTLTGKGLLDARPRRGTYVLPRVDWDLLDNDVMSWHTDVSSKDSFLTDLHELRRMIEPWAACLAAERRTDEDLTVIGAALKRMDSTRSRTRRGAKQTLAAHVEADIAFHVGLLHATHNELVARLDRILNAVLNYRDRLIPEELQSDKFVDEHRDVYTAVAAGDGDAATAAMSALLNNAAEHLREVTATRVEGGG